MRLGGLITRELLWWLRSPSLWWCLPPLMVFFSCFPQFTLWAGGVDLTSFGTLWNGFSGLYRMFGGRQIFDSGLSLPGMADAGSALADNLDRLLRSGPEALLRQYALPWLQAWGMIVAPSMVSPLAIGVFNRDRDQGMFLLHRVQGGGFFKLLLAKQIALGLQLLWMQALCWFAHLYLFRAMSPWDSLFSYDDPLWLMCWIGGGVGLGVFAITVSWGMCLLSRNGQSEMYTSMVICSVIVALLMVLLGLHPLDLALATWITAGSLLLSLLFSLSLARAMRRERFFLA